MTDAIALQSGIRPLSASSGVLGAGAVDLDAAREAAAGGREDEVSVAFEKLLATMLVRELRRALPEGPFGGGAGADVYESWFDQHLGETLAERDALGLAGLVKTSIGRAQEARATAAGGGAA